MSDVESRVRNSPLKSPDGTVCAKTLLRCRGPVNQSRDAVLEHVRVHIEIVAEGGRVLGTPKEDASENVLEVENDNARHVVQLGHLGVIHREEDPSAGARKTKAVALADHLWQPSFHGRAL